MSNEPKASHTLSMRTTGNTEQRLDFLWDCGLIDSLCMDDGDDRTIMFYMTKWVLETTNEQLSRELAWEQLEMIRSQLEPKEEIIHRLIHGTTRI